MRLTVNVTQSMIENGETADCEECPVAIAIYRALIDTYPEHAELIPFVTGIGTMLRTADGLCAYAADPLEQVRDFIRAFDGGKRVEPFSFELEFEECGAE